MDKFYEVWDDAAGTKLTGALPEEEAKAYALHEDPAGARLFLEDANGNLIAWNAHADPPCWEGV